MGKKTIVVPLIGLALALAHPVEAQQPKKVPLIGYLSNSDRSGDAARSEGIRFALRERGYIEGQNIAIRYRYADGKIDRFPDLAAELVRLKVDVIVTVSTPAAVAAKNATTTIPIVMAGGSDPVATGLIPSLARPGGNITGITLMNAETAGKRLQLLKETSPKVSRVAVLWNSDNPGTAVVFKQTQAAAQDLGLQLLSMEVKSVNGLSGAFEAITRGGANALVGLQSVPISTHLREVADFAVKNLRQE
jgi:putative ABC transport system substrate-binding protein